MVFKDVFKIHLKHIYLKNYLTFFAEVFAFEFKFTEYLFTVQFLNMIVLIHYNKLCLKILNLISKFL